VVRDFEQRSFVIIILHQFLGGRNEHCIKVTASFLLDDALGPKLQSERERAPKTLPYKRIVEAQEKYLAKNLVVVMLTKLSVLNEMLLEVQDGKDPLSCGVIVDVLVAAGGIKFQYNLCA
jgi:hypothetical protein